jgi:hypothetical protein
MHELKADFPHNLGFASLPYLALETKTPTHQENALGGRGLRYLFLGRVRLWNQTSHSRAQASGGRSSCKRPA